MSRLVNSIVFAILMSLTTVIMPYLIFIVFPASGGLPMDIIGYSAWLIQLNAILVEVISFLSIQFNLPLVILNGIIFTSVGTALIAINPRSLAKPILQIVFMIVAIYCFWVGSSIYSLFLPQIAFTNIGIQFQFDLPFGGSIGLTLGLNYLFNAACILGIHGVIVIKSLLKWAYNFE